MGGSSPGLASGLGDAGAEGRLPYKLLVRSKTFPTWRRAQRRSGQVTARVESHRGASFSRVGSVVTNLEIDGHAGIRLYNERDTAEQWIKEGK